MSKSEASRPGRQGVSRVAGGVDLMKKVIRRGRQSRDPKTGTRVSRIRAPSQWTRIVDRVRQDEVALGII